MLASSEVVTLCKEASHASSENLLTWVQERRQRQPNSTRQSGGLQQMDTSTQSKLISLVASLIGLALSKLHQSSRSQAAMGSQQLYHLALLLLAIWMCEPLSLMIPMILMAWVLTIPVMVPVMILMSSG